MILRFENAEDVYDKEVSSNEIAVLRQLEETHGDPLDLFRFDEVRFERLMALPDLPFDEDREFDLSIVLY